MDRRALASLRVGVAAVTLVDLALRAPDISAFYTDLGVFPLDVAVARAPLGALSLYFLGARTSPAVTALLAIHAVAAAAMLVGFRTRLATGLVWALTVSLHARNPLVLQGGDDLLRVVLFWGMFLPLGAVWSLDAQAVPASGDGAQGEGRLPRERGTRVSFATAGLLLQVAGMYAVTSLHKTGAEWRDGSAVWVALAHDHFGRPWAQAAFLPHPDATRVLGRAVLWVERLAPVALLSPWRTRITRPLGIASLAVLQAGFGATL